MGNVLQLKQLCSTLRQVQDSTDTEIESYKVSHTTHALLNYFINTKDQTGKLELAPENSNFQDILQLHKIGRLSKLFPIL